MCLTLLTRYGKPVLDSKNNLVISVKSTSIDLRKTIKGEIVVSCLDLPYASLVEYTGDYLRVYTAGYRPLNDLELSVMREWRKIEQTSDFIRRSEIDALSDSSCTYYQQKAFFSSSSCPYLFSDGYSKSYCVATNMVKDPKIKGDCILEYRVSEL